MKTIANYSFLAGLVMSIACAGAALPDHPQPAAASQFSAFATNRATATVTVDRSMNGVLLNFHVASLSLVLDYLSEEAGFIINNETAVQGIVEMWSKGPVTRDEAD